MNNLEIYRNICKRINQLEMIDVLETLHTFITSSIDDDNYEFVRFYNDSKEIIVDVMNRYPDGSEGIVGGFIIDKQTGIVNYN